VPNAELQRSLAFIFLRKGKEYLTEKEIVYSASMDLRWFSPKDAQRLLDIGLREKLLERRDGSVRLGFDPKALELPLDFRPTKAALEEPAELRNPFVEVLERLSAARGLARKAIVSKINHKQEALAIDAEVAALLIARELDVDVSDLYDRVESELRARML